MVLPTCQLEFKDQRLSPNFAEVFAGIFLVHAVDHQLTAFSLGLSAHSLAGSQLFAVLVPLHLSLGIGHFAAQRGFLGERGFHLLLD